MKRWISVAAVLAVLLTTSPPANAAVNVERQGTENPVIEIAKSTAYGALAGMLIGAAIDLAGDGDESEAIRWGTVIGTFAGLGGGIYFVATRPSPDALLQIDEGQLQLHASVVEFTGDGARVRLAGVRF